MVTVSTTILPAARRWSLAEFYHLGEIGWFRGQEAELLNGEILVMSPQGALHYLCLERVADAVGRAFGAGYFVRRQAPLELDQETDPEPDVAVVRGGIDDQRQHPSTALLVVEIALTSLAHDRERKAALYALAGVEGFWIVNLVDRQLEVRRRPQVDAIDSTRAVFAEQVVFGPADSVRPLAAGNAVSVANLLP